MAEALAALEGSDVATWLRYSRWGYAAVNTAHVLGIALLVGAILPLDLRLLSLWSSVPRDALVRVLAPTAAAGLLLAATAGLLLFSVRASEYAALPLLWVKLALVATGASAALAHHLRYGALLQRAGPRQLAWAGATSMVCWLGALVAGRMIAFVAD
jgi:hypothetical protein